MAKNTSPGISYVFEQRRFKIFLWSNKNSAFHPSFSYTRLDLFRYIF